MNGHEAFIAEFQKFLRPTLRGKLRRLWRWAFPPRTPLRTDGFEVGDFICINDVEHRVASKTGDTITMESGAVLTL